MTRKIRDRKALRREETERNKGKIAVRKENERKGRRKEQKEIGWNK